MGITIEDVARQANVSVATVSRARNGHDNVADSVRRRVVSMASQLRCSSHHPARTLGSRYANIVGVVLSKLCGEFFSELMRGIDTVARDRGFHLLVSSCHGNLAAQTGARRAVRGRVDGLLVLRPFVRASPLPDDHARPVITAMTTTASAMAAVASPWKIPSQHLMKIR